MFALLLAACLLAGLVPAVASAQVIERDGYSFDTGTGALHIKNDAGSTQWRSDPDIPKEAVKSVTFQRLDTPVLNLGPSAFEGCVNLTGTIKLNADATSIGENAFLGCDKVDLILIPQGGAGGYRGRRDTGANGVGRLSVRQKRELEQLLCVRRTLWLSNTGRL